MSNRLRKLFLVLCLNLHIILLLSLKGVVSVSGVVANGVMGDGGSVSVAEGVGNDVMVGENVGNGVTESVQEVLDNGDMVNGVGRSPSQVMNNVSGLVSQVNVVAGGVMENGFIGEVANGVMENAVSSAAVRAVNNGVAGASSSSLGDGANGVMGNGVGRAGARVMNNGDAGARSFSLGGAAAGSVPRVDMDRLLRNFNQEIREDIARLRFWERMQLEDVEKGTRALLMMRETEAKIGEKARLSMAISNAKNNTTEVQEKCIGRLRLYHFCVNLSVTLASYPVFRFIGMRSSLPLPSWAQIWHAGKCKWHKFPKI
ncbi:hypothetical protein Tco_0103421 [Tanacetum coccineum]